MVNLDEYDDLVGIDSKWQSLDGATTKAPRSGGKGPTDRGKLVVKRSVLTDGQGIPIGVAVDGANVHDQILVNETLDSIPVRRPTPGSYNRQHLRCDKGYDAHSVRSAADERGYIEHIPRKNSDTTLRKRNSAGS